jgi:tripartite-type tricarboxylate transporter receptor subunit TctC
MILPRRKFLHLAAGAGALPMLSRIARAQAYPTKPITLAVPFAAGGGTDVIARIIAEPMRVSLGQTIIIENVTGANGSIGVGRVARSASDGYTLVIGTFGTHVGNGVLYPLQYDLLKDFEPISPITTQPYLIVTRKTFPANNLKALVDWLKANPDKATAGTQGMGGASHVGGVAFQNAIGTRLRFVPYRGGAPAVQDLVAGRIDLMVASTSDALQQVLAGTIRAYALTAATRSAGAPEIPSTDEAGVPGFYYSGWFGLWAPARTPKDIIGKLNSAAVTALSDPKVQDRLAQIGQELFPRDQQTPEALAAFQKAEIEKWWPIIKAANIQGE